MNENLKKIIAGIIGVGVIGGGVLALSDKPDCDYEIQYEKEEKTVCITNEQFDAIIENLNKTEEIEWGSLRSWDQI